MTSRLLTVAESCDRLSVSRPTLYGLINEGRLPSVKIGRARRIRECDLDRFIEDHIEVPEMGPAA